MKILLTGDKGFVGSHIRAGLESVYHVRAGVESIYNVVGLDVRGEFQEWIEDMNAAMDTDIDAVIHVGAISNNQSQAPNVFLWNSYATYLLAQRVSQKMDGRLPIPFIFFSTFLVGSTMDDWSTRTPYAWSKVQAEDFVRNSLPHATILRPCVMWGNENAKVSTNGSVPYRLATHDLEYMFRDWARKYVHVSDVVEAVKLCLYNQPRGTFDLAPDHFWTNQQLAELIEWKEYQWIDSPKEVGFKYVSSHVNRDELPTPPDWMPKVLMEEELPRLEKELN